MKQLARVVNLQLDRLAQQVKRVQPDFRASVKTSYTAAGGDTTETKEGEGT